MMLRRVAARALGPCTVVLVLAAVLVTALRLALPLADGYRDRVAEALSERLGYPVRVGALSVRLVGFAPRLTLDAVSLRDPLLGTEVLRLRTLELEPDLLDSLRLGAPQWRALILVGARLAVRRLRDGRIRVVGLSALTTDDPRPLELFLTQGRLDLIDSEILLADDRLGGPVLRLDDLRLRLRNDGRDHRLALSARPAAASAGATARPGAARLQLWARLAGDASDLATWSGRLDWSLAGADLADLVPPALLPAAWASPRLHSRELRWDVWMRLAAGRPAEALSRIGLRNVGWQPEHADAPARPAAASGGERLAAAPARQALGRLDTLVRLTADGEGWRVQTADLQLASDGWSLDGIGLDLGLSRDGRIARLDLSAAPLDLAGVAALGRVVAPPLPSALEPFLELQPSGWLDRLAVRLDLPPDAAPRWRVQARGQGLALVRRGRIPGFAGLALALDANQDGGAARLGSAGLTLDLAPLFDRPLGLEQLDGSLAWTRDPDGALHLVGQRLTAENADLRGRARFALDLPAAGSEVGPFLDLRATFSDGNGAHVRPYLPVGILHKDLVAWLEQALVTARIAQADLVLRGPLRRYPFRHGEGQYELLLDFEDGTIDYLKGWPPIEEAAGELHFLNQSLEIAVDRGRLYRTRLLSATASIPDLWHPPRLFVQAQAQGPLSDGLRILGETPLSRQLGPLARALEADGGLHLDLGLAIPLIRGEPLGVDGRVTWPGPARIGLKGTPIALAGLRGELGFTANALAAPAIAGQLWGRPVALSIATRHPGDAESSTTEIRARARLPVRELAARLPTPAWRLARGDLDLSLGVDLRNADLQGTALPLALSLRSDLRGLALDLPPPLGKPAERAAALDLRGELVPGRRLGLAGAAGPVALALDLDLGPRGPRLERGQVRLGGKPAALPAAPGLALDGSVERLDLPAWSAWWERVRGELKELAAAGDTAGPNLRSAELRIGRLDLGSTVLERVKLGIAPPSGPPPADGWVLSAQSQALAGQLTIPPGRDPTLALAFSRLDLKALAGLETDAGDPVRSRPLPALTLRVDDLRWGEGSLGRLSLAVAPDDLGTRVTGIDFRGVGDTALTGEAAWIDGEGAGRGRVSLVLHSSDPGPLLQELESANAVTQAPLESSLQLEWPGNLQDFSLANATGLVQFEFGPGSLPKLEPGVGRVLGFLNLGALTRRLSLDFRDLYQQGLSFERIAGRIRLGNGRATVQSFEIAAPASQIRVSGYSNLHTRTFDQTVTVEPSIGTSVAIASAVAGGPAVGAAVYALNRLSGGAIDRFGSFQYRVTGPWSDPVVQPIGWEPFARTPNARPGKTPGSGSAGPDQGGNLFLD